MLPEDVFTDQGSGYELAQLDCTLKILVAVLWAVLNLMM